MVGRDENITVEPVPKHGRYQFRCAPPRPTHCRSRCNDVRLHTFGRAYIADDGGQEVALQPLPVALLAYLAVGGPRHRDHLAELFWHSGKNRLNSLSTTLNRIRAQVPGGVWVEGNTLVGTDLSCDVDGLRDAIERADFDTLTQLYTAPFLESLKLRRQSNEFEEWVLEERATLAAMVELALLQRGRQLYDSGEFRAAAKTAEKAWGIAVRGGFPSPDYFELYHRVLAAAANPTANAVRAMADEFGIVLAPIEPVSTVPTAVEPTGSQPTSIGSPAATATVAAASPVGDNTVTGATQFFGCQDELAAVESSVASQKLTTIIGLGGSGKTRTAAEFFNSPSAERDFPRRYWVNLRDVAEHDLVAPAIATSIGRRFVDVATLADGLPDDQPVLLVLDNFEHVMRAAGNVEELIQRNEAVRVLVTSRIPLEIDTESLVRLSGLDTTNQELVSPAEQLFASSARRAGAGENRLDGLHREAIRDVCRKVGGNPLALEIAGGWAQVFSPSEILETLSSGNDLLGSSIVGDRSLEAVLNQSWSSLGETEQKTLMLLATFPGGCLTKEALKIVELPIRSIGRLVQHSLVRLHIEGRITLHPLIARHALSELEQRPDLHRQFHQVLCDWCRRFVANAQPSSGSTHSLAFDAEVANFATAWSWAAQHRLWELHRQTHSALRQFFNESGRVSEGRALFSVVAEALASDPDHPQDLLAAVLEALGWFQLLTGESPQARTQFDRALAISTDDDRYGRAQILRSLGFLHLATGEIDEATVNLKAGLALIADEPGALTAWLQYDLAQAHHYRGERDQAKSAARLALHAGRETDNWSVMATSYLLLADVEVETDPQRAIVLLNEGWVIAKDASLDSLAIYFPHILGLAHLRLQEADRAETYFTDGIRAANNVGQLTTVCANHVGRAEARLLLASTDDAVEDLKTAIRLGLKTGNGRYLMWAAVVACRAHAARQQAIPQAKELLLLVLRHPAADREARDKASASLKTIFNEVAEPDIEPVGEGAPGSLDEIAERSLQLLFDY